MRAILITAILTFSAATGMAQDPSEAPSGGRVIDLAPTTVTGTPQRPGAFYVMSRTRNSTDVDELRTSFVRRVVQSARRAPLAE